MDEVIALFDSLFDSRLNSWCLKIRLSIFKVNVTMSSHEWIEHAKLIKHNEQIFGGLAIEPWDVGTSEWYACNT